ncbi:MAG: hypothetical protein JO154_05550 [Chitinophaga sp.]|uniref:hypothetical protein n=1 Tax=Chitinophaga sp. TaxID=1869181 RepID=UPI0025C62616|nr:hypothetical protein [Chitinophaga sp.]MBV8252053.1 hypothetical protein [Chitinophaga sp.]
MSLDLFTYLMFACFFLLFFIARFFTIMIHELGHALTAIKFTKQYAIVYIGSYEDASGCIQINKGLLEINIKKNPLTWVKGLCIASEDDMTLKQRLIQVLAGPLSSFVIAIVAAVIVFAFDMHGSIKLMMAIFLLSAMIDLLINLRPSTFRTYNYGMVDSDGRQALELIRDWYREREILKGRGRRR